MFANGAISATAAALTDLAVPLDACLMSFLNDQRVGQLAPKAAAGLDLPAGCRLSLSPL